MGSRRACSALASASARMRIHAASGRSTVTAARRRSRASATDSRTPHVIKRRVTLRFPPLLTILLSHLDPVRVKR